MIVVISIPISSLQLSPYPFQHTSPNIMGLFLPLYAWLWGHQLLCGKPSNGLILTEEWISLSLLTINYK